MSGIFLSYSRVDRELASHIVFGLRSLGVDVWWDEDMPGVDWQEELKRQLNELSAVLVIWSPASTASKNVMAEARLGDRREKLINIIWGVASPPPPFDAINGLPLTGWTDREPHNGWSRVVRTVEDFLVRTGSVTAGHVTSALAERERTIRGRQDAISVAIEAYQAAQGAEAEASERKVRAGAALTAAEEQLRWMVERHATQSVVRAAQTEIDQALLASADAETHHRDAATQLATAARAMTRSQAELERMFEAGRTFAPLQGAASPPKDPEAAAEGEAPVEDPPQPVAAPVAAAPPEVAVADSVSEDEAPPQAPSPPAAMGFDGPPAVAAPAAPDPAPTAAVPSPPAVAAATPASAPAATAAPPNQFLNFLPLILGILSVPLIWVPLVDLGLPIAAVITGIVNLRKHRPRGPALIGAWLGAIDLLLIVVLVLVAVSNASRD
ncbi:MAG TPA: toll/interleukin-1 receptor domain-containing protein [Caulobacteraceae bacterium]|nr:toll/interleukin-1 receptor domain-containing protein [Caulobacteraceae bacterium]